MRIDKLSTFMLPTENSCHDVTEIQIVMNLVPDGGTGFSLMWTTFEGFIMHIFLLHFLHADIANSSDA